MSQYAVLNGSERTVSRNGTPIVPSQTPLLQVYKGVDPMFATSTATYYEMMVSLLTRNTLHLTDSEG
jgi:hypothetical protein